MTPQEIIQAKKDKENPAVAAYRLIQQLGDQLKAQIDEEMSKMKADFSAQIADALKETKGKAKIEVNGSGIASLQGPTGPMGPTPEKGKHYFTPEDISQIQDGIIEKVTPQKGVHYNDGAPGYTPKKGVDYFTHADIQSILRQATPMKGFHYKDGENGKNGRAGRDGKDGRDGSPDSVNEVARKFLAAVKNGLITLPDTEKLATQLRGEIVTSARQNKPAKMAHGGGMTLKAGSGQTLTRNSDGTWSLTVSGSAVNFVDNEVVSGSGTTWTLASTPIAGSVRLSGGGGRMTPGAGNDYTISGANITTVNIFSAGQLIADYRT